jgi:hypothetical protein
MLGLVFGLAGAIVVYVVRMVRREERERLAREQPTLSTGETHGTDPGR